MIARTYKQGDRIAVIATVIKPFDDGRMLADLNGYLMMLEPSNLAITQPLTMERLKEGIDGR
jgi:hypothetical protein